MLYTIANHFVAPAAQNAFVFHTSSSASIDTAGFVQAATEMAAWTKDGYFPEGYQGLSDVQALNLFDQGKAGFFLEGDWYSGTVNQALGANAGFWVPPVVTGGPGEGWSIPAKAANPNAGAAIINVLLSPAIQNALLKNGDIPAVQPSASALAAAGGRRHCDRRPPAGPTPCTAATWSRTWTTPRRTSSIRRWRACRNSRPGRPPRPR
jgi:raffinose/stachyose/melibiose transport system substrate-binding protein